MRVVAAGLPAWDRIVLASGGIASGSSTLVERVAESGGGQAATAGVACARLGAKVWHLGSIGDDREGACISEGFTEEGVDVEGLRVQEGARTASSFIFVHGEDRTILFDAGTAEERPLDADQARVLGMAEGLLIERPDALTTEAAKKVRSAGGIVLADLDAWIHDQAAYLEHVDIVIASAAALSRQPPNDYLQSLLELGPREAIVTLGSAGAIGMTRGGAQVRIPAAPSVVRDTTGAGDAYHGAFLFAALNQKLLEDSMRFAAVVAAATCESFGGRSGLPTLPETEGRLQEWRGLT